MLKAQATHVCSLQCNDICFLVIARLRSLKRGGRGSLFMSFINCHVEIRPPLPPPSLPPHFE